MNKLNRMKKGRMIREEERGKYMAIGQTKGTVKAVREKGGKVIRYKQNRGKC
jgi:hypothetical protein